MLPGKRPLFPWTFLKAVRMLSLRRPLMGLSCAATEPAFFPKTLAVIPKVPVRVPGPVPAHELSPDSLDKTFRFRPIAGFVRHGLLLIGFIEGSVIPGAFLGPLKLVPVLFRPLLMPSIRMAIFLMEIPGLGILVTDTPAFLAPLGRPGIGRLESALALGPGFIPASLGPSMPLRGTSMGCGPWSVLFLS